MTLNRIDPGYSHLYKIFDNNGAYDPLSTIRIISELRESEFYRCAHYALQDEVAFTEFMREGEEEMFQAEAMFAARAGAGEWQVTDPALQEAIRRKNLVELLAEMHEKTGDIELALDALRTHFRDAYRLAESIVFLSGYGNMSHHIPENAQWPTPDANERRVYQDLGDTRWRIVSIFPEAT